jgi:putative hydrolase of the HAD superfamily
MPEALAELKGLGLRLGCVSNAFMGAKVLHSIMEERGLGPHLEMTISSCDFGWRKPHPSIYEAAVSSMGVTNAEVIFVGDRVEQDVVGPARLGMRAVLTLQYRQENPEASSVRPDAVIGHLSELPDVARELLS